MHLASLVSVAFSSQVIGTQMVLNLFGVMIGPALIAGISRMNYDICWFHFNEQTAPGYIMAALQLCLLISFLTTFVEPPPKNDKRRKTIRRKSLEER